MSSIDREDTIEILKDLQKDHLQFCLIPFRQAIERVQALPSTDTDISEYSDKLWKNAYERGKADRPQEWIPCSEGMPKKTGYYICTCKDGAKYKRTTVVKWSNGWQLTGSRSYWVVVAWMPLPKPWKGADDDL